MICNICYFICL